MSKINRRPAKRRSGCHIGARSPSVFTGSEASDGQGFRTRSMRVRARPRQPCPRRRLTAAATASGVSPEMLVQVRRSAEAPNPVMPMNTPSGPSQRSQPNPPAASIPTRKAAPSTVRAIGLRPELRTVPSTAARRRPSAMPSAASFVAGLHRDRDLRSGGDQRGLARPFRLGQHVAAAGAAVLRRIGPQRRQRLPRQHQQARPIGPAHRQFPALRRLHRVGRAIDMDVRHRAQAGEVLDRLMRRSVLAQADGVMRQHVDHPLAHDRAQAGSPGACSR